jgi:hypothetical protein
LVYSTRYKDNRHKKTKCVEWGRGEYHYMRVGSFREGGGANETSDL